MGKNMTNKLWLKKQLYSLQMPEGGDLIAHIQKFSQVCSDVMNPNVKIDEEDRALLLFCSLSFFYDGLIVGNYVPKPIISLLMVKLIIVIVYELLNL